MTSNVTPFPPGGAGAQKPGGEQPARNGASAGESLNGSSEEGAPRDGAAPHGSKTAELVSLRERLINDVLTALSLGPYVPVDVYERRCTGVKSAIDQAEPADEIEGMLMTQMLTAHSRGLGFVRMSLTEEFIDERVRCAYILAATRLLSLVRRQSYALTRHRDWLAQRERRAKDGRRRPRKKPLREPNL